MRLHEKMREKWLLQHVYLRDDYFTRDAESLARLEHPKRPGHRHIRMAGLYPPYWTRLTLISGARKKWT